MVEVKTVLKVHRPYRTSLALPPSETEVYLMVEKVDIFSPYTTADGARTCIVYNNRSVFVTETPEEIAAQLEEPHSPPSSVDRHAMVAQLAGSALGVALMTEIMGGRKEDVERNKATGKVLAEARKALTKR